MANKLLSTGTIEDTLVAVAAGTYLLGFIAAVEVALAKLVY